MKAIQRILASPVSMLVRRSATQVAAQETAAAAKEGLGL